MVAWLDALRRRLTVLIRDSDLVTRNGSRVLYDDLESRCLTGKDRIAAGRANPHTTEVARTVVHRGEPESGEQEGQAEREVVPVVHRAQEHREQHEPVRDAQARREDIDSPRRKREWVRIVTVATPRPAANSWTQGKPVGEPVQDRKSTRLNSSHVKISYAV